MTAIALVTTMRSIGKFSGVTGGPQDKATLPHQQRSLLFVLLFVFLSSSAHCAASTRKSCSYPFTDCTAFSRCAAVIALCTRA